MGQSKKQKAESRNLCFICVHLWLIKMRLEYSNIEIRESRTDGLLAWLFIGALLLAIAMLTGCATNRVEQPPLPPVATKHQMELSDFNFTVVGSPPTPSVISIMLPTNACMMQLLDENLNVTYEWYHDPHVYTPNIVFTDDRPNGAAFVRMKP